MWPIGRIFGPHSVCLIVCSLDLLLMNSCCASNENKFATKTSTRPANDLETTKRVAANDHLKSLSGSSAEHLNVDRARRSATTRNRTTTNLVPKFSTPIGNVSAVLGRDVRLVCQVENLGSYQVAWLKEESGTILSIDTNIIITNYRIFLIPDEEGRKWVLHIKDVQESDRGFYQCQINTKPMQSISGHLEVVVPPSFIEPQTSQVAEVEEFSNVSMQCKANGHPRPTITWRRDDGRPIKLTGRPPVGVWNGNQQGQPTSSGESSSASQSGSKQKSTRPRGFSSGRLQRIAAERQASQQDNGLEPANSTSSSPPNEQQPPASHQLNDVKSDKLTLINVDRSMGGLYVCAASNGIPSQVSKRISLYVKFEPKVSIQNKYISVSLNEQLEIDCLVESFPKANTYCSKKPLQLQAESGGDAPTSSAYALGPLVVAGDTSRRAIFHRQRQLQEQHQASSAPESLHRQPPSGDTSEVELLEPLDANENSPADHGADDELTLQQQRHQMEKDNFLQQSNLFGKQFSSKFIASSSDRLSSPGPLEPRRRRQTELEPAAAEDLSLSSLTNDDSNEQQQATDGTPTATTTGHGKLKAAGQNQNFITIKQTPVNPYTYRQKFIINRMQASDYGEYVCVSSNSLGQSVAHVIVTRADRQQQQQQHDGDEQAKFHQQHPNEQLMSDENDSRKGENLNNNNNGPDEATGVRFKNLGQTSQRVVVYDENYLQTIKNRQLANGIAPGRLQQKLKMKPDRSGSISNLSARISLLHALVFVAVAFSWRLVVASDYG